MSTLGPLASRLKWATPNGQGIAQKNEVVHAAARMASGAGAKINGFFVPRPHVGHHFNHSLILLKMPQDGGL